MTFVWQGGVAPAMGQPLTLLAKAGVRGKVIGKMDWRPLNMGLLCAREE
jgi:hypothetical protein